MKGWHREAREEIEKQKTVEEQSSFSLGFGEGNAKHKYTMAARKQMAKNTSAQVYRWQGLMKIQDQPRLLANLHRCHAKM